MKELCKVKDGVTEIEMEDIENQENFDVERWRIDNPPDYFKAARLLMQFDTGVASDTAFEAIFRVFKLYIPDRLFKYQSLGLDSKVDGLRFETLRNNRIYTSPIQDLNDPFDSYCYFYDADAIGRNLGIANSDVDDIFGVFRKSRVASLTSVGEQSMPMWAHYANNHRGFCVEYDMANQDNALFKSFLFPVQYSEKRIDLTSFFLNKTREEVSQALLGLNDGRQEVRINDKSLIYIPHLLANIKHPSWSYEKEFRCMIPENSPIAPYINAVPAAIYAGMNCAERDLAELRKICKELNIPLFSLEMNACDSNYRLAKHQYA